MKGDRIPDQDYVSRYCSPKTVDNGEIQAPAFFLKLGKESISVNWLENLNLPDRNREIVEVRRVYSNKLKVKEDARIAVLEVGKVREKVLNGPESGKNLKIEHDPIINQQNPSLNDPSHSGFYGLEPEDEEVAELILQTNPKIYLARI